MKHDFFEQLQSYIAIAPDAELHKLQTAITYQVRENKRKTLEAKFAEQKEQREKDARVAEREATGKS